jgi:MOSC domain-containing protein YiiM
MPPRLLAVDVGLPREHTWRGRIVRTGVWKEPVAGRQMVRRLNIDGDGQGDVKGHRGEQRAVLVYQLESYRYWGRELGRPEFAFGQFGENFTVDSLSDGEVCIGDRYRIGEALFEVGQPAARHLLPRRTADGRGADGGPATLRRSSRCEKRCVFLEEESSC